MKASGQKMNKSSQASVQSWKPKGSISRVINHIKLK